MTRLGRLALGAVAAAAVAAGGVMSGGGPTGVQTAAAEDEAIFIPLTVYRTGPYAPNGIPIANGWRDYLRMLNARDGGINGVPIEFEECETRYDTKLGVECYEKLKNNGAKGAVVFNPLSTGITYQLIPKARADKIPLHTMGYGRTAAADGRVFKWTFNFPSHYWSQASAFIKYIESQTDDIGDLKIGLIYHNSPYGKEPIPTLEKLSEMKGYELVTYAVDHPGQEQSSTWLQIRRDRPDWLIMWGWGVMNQVAVKEATNIRYNMDHFIGNWWAGAEPDVTPSGAAAKGYKAGNTTGVGTDFPVLDEIVEHVYDGDMAAAKEEGLGSVLYNRGVGNMIYDVEAIRTAMEKYGNRALSGEEVHWGFENLEVTSARLEDLGATGLIPPIQITCRNHEGSGKIFIQEWDGSNWNRVSDWIEPDNELLRPMVEAAAKAYAEENGLPIRDCDKES